MSLINWIKPSLEGIDGRSSARSLTNAWYVVINTIITVCILFLAKDIISQPHPNDKSVDTLWALIWLCVIFNVTILVIFGIVSIQQVTQGIRAFRGQPEPQPQPGDDIDVIVTAKVPEKKEEI